jgi:hypothetical protein
MPILAPRPPNFVGREERINVLALPVSAADAIAKWKEFAFS